MAFLTTCFASLGVLLLTHAIYSAYEHSLLPNSTATHATLPVDIILEALFSTLLVTASIVLAAPELRPIRWSEWAGKIEREGWDPRAEGNKQFLGDMSDLGKVKGGLGNPYKALEERRAFWDVRTSRNVFADYIRGGTPSEQKAM